MKYVHESLESIIGEKKYKQLTSHNCVFSLEYLIKKGVKPIYEREINGICHLQKD